MKYDLHNNMHIHCLLVLLLLVSCVPDRFTLDKISGQNRIEGFEMRSIHDAEVNYDNAFTLNENGCVSLRAVNSTDGVWDFGFNFLFGENLNICLRDVPFEYQSPRALCINITNKVIRITDKGKEVFTVNCIYDFSNAIRIKLVNDGFNYAVVLDCDTIYKGRTNIPSTEYIIFESLKNTKAFVSGIDFKNK